MYCKIFERVCGEPGYSLKKTAGKKGGGLRFTYKI
jgi:hypothetical protein